MKRYIHFILVILTLMLVGSVTSDGAAKAVSYENKITTGFIIDETLSITISDDELSIGNLLPGQYADSNSVDITVTTNSPYGYTLTGTVGDNAHKNRNLTHTTDSTEAFSSLDINYNAANLASFTDDRWGFSTSENNGGSWSAYSGLPLYTDSSNVVVLKEAGASSAEAGDKLSFKIGARASSTRASGTYENVVNFTVVGKPKPLYMQSIDTWRNTLMNVGDEVIAADIRDNKKYTVGVQADGNIWMTQNLDFEITSTALNSDNTDLNVYNTDGYSEDSGYSIENGKIKWIPASTAYTANATVPVSTTTGSVNGVTGTSESSYYEPYSAEGGDVYVYTSGSNSDDIIFTSLDSCVATGHTENECRHYHRGNYYNWSAAVANNNTNVAELKSDYVAQNSICPAGWRLPGYDFSTYTGDVKELLSLSGIIEYSNSYVTNGFNNIRIAPLYFVRAGATNNSSLSESGTHGYYWSNAVFSAYNAYSLQVRKEVVNTDWGFNRTNKISLRCLTEGPINYMQDTANIKAKLTNAGDTMIAVDRRDNHKYTVGKLADGNIWLLDNLAFDGTNGDGTTYIRMDSTNTNITREITWNSSMLGSNNYISLTYTTPAFSKYIMNNMNTSDSLEAARKWRYGITYNYCAAIAAEQPICNSNSVEQDATEDICPAGWRLPTGGEGGEYDALYTSFGYDTAVKYRNALRLPLSGYAHTAVSKQGSDGYFWSSTVAGEQLWYYMRVNKTSVYPYEGHDKGWGQAVRCIMK